MRLDKITFDLKGILRYNCRMKKGDASMNDMEEIMEKYHYGKQMLETEIDILIKEFSFNHGYNPVEHIKSRIKSKRV